MRMCLIRVEKNLQQSNIGQYYDDTIQNINLCLVQVLLMLGRVFSRVVASNVSAFVEQPVLGIRIPKK